MAERTLSLTACLTTGLLILWSIPAFAQVPSVTTLDSAAALPCPPELLGAPATGYRGTRSCAAVACHGNAESNGIEEQEYVCWLENDPHATSHHSLQSELGQRMLRLLGIQRGSAAYQNCVACHDPYVDSLVGDPVRRIGEGVGCEACHGPSDQWIGLHYQTSWTSADSATKASLYTATGMVHTENLATRARLCATCHVGDQDREVNHDLIAAGHPPLKFELAAYHDLLPAHWNRQRERRAQPDFEIHLWSVGQLASARAAVRVLESRARRAAAGSATSPHGTRHNQGGRPAPWPELSEYNCFSCHQDLTEPSWRQTRGYDNRQLGMASWQSWYFGLPTTVWAAQIRDVPAADFSALKQLMDRGYRPAPADVADQAAALSQALESSLLDSISATANGGEHRRQLIDAIRSLDAQSEASPLLANWDHTAQAYLTLCAIHQAEQDRMAVSSGVKPLSNSLQRLRQKLNYPSGLDSPRSFQGFLTATDGASQDSEASRRQVREALQEAIRLLP